MIEVLPVLTKLIVHIVQHLFPNLFNLVVLYLVVVLVRHFYKLPLQLLDSQHTLEYTLPVVFRQGQHSQHTAPVIWLETYQLP